MGSSPRVRGSHAIVLLVARRNGIIPAGAGLTSRHPDTMHHCRDHPRGCGAHPTVKHCPECRAGSSPRVRGSLLREAAPSCAMGIIPAGAGLTMRPFGRYRPWRDHPRGCGAHCTQTFLRVWRQGSSPRVRGSRRCTSRERCRHGIIPAGAGLTHMFRPIRQTSWDHPRGCGAHSFRALLYACSEGSSPRVRGSRRDGEPVPWPLGIIPAGAGLT